MQQWYYAVDGQQLGPVSGEQMVELHAHGTIDASSLVWRDGLGDWQPLSMHMQSLGIGKPVAAKPAAPPPAPRAEPAAAASTPYAPPRAAAPEFSQSELQARSEYVIHAGFLRRWAALILDSIILGIALMAVMMIIAIPLGLFSFNSGGDEFVAAAQGIYYLLYFIAAPLYYAGQESSAAQATLGKRVIGIKVCDLEGRPLSFMHALGRWAAAALSYLTMYIGFFMAAFTEKKQALHDLIASTYVVDRWAFTDQPDKQKTGPTGCLVIALVLLLPAIAVLGILAAIAVPAYQDYTIRARISETLYVASSAKVGVSEYVAANERCPSDWTDLAMDAPASQYASLFSLAETGSGLCQIEITMGPIEGNYAIANQHIWLQRELDDSWTCSSDIASKNLPTNCR
ncbi:MAG: RDD family protein [Pseudomarimonas sp.]